VRRRRETLALAAMMQDQGQIYATDTDKFFVSVLRRLG